MHGTAKARFQRLSPRKARVVLRMVQGQPVAAALSALRFCPKGAARVVAKVIDSAIANAQQRDQSIDLDRLVVVQAVADKAPDQHMRRWRPRAMGRATRIVKGMSHIKVMVAQR